MVDDEKAAPSETGVALNEFEASNISHEVTLVKGGDGSIIPLKPIGMTEERSADNDDESNNSERGVNGRYGDDDNEDNYSDDFDSGSGSVSSSISSGSSASVVSFSKESSSVGQGNDADSEGSFLSLEAVPEGDEESGNVTDLGSDGQSNRPDPKLDMDNISKAESFLSLEAVPEGSEDEVELRGEERESGNKEGVERLNGIEDEYSFYEEPDKHDVVSKDEIASRSPGKSSGSSKRGSQKGLSSASSSSSSSSISGSSQTTQSSSSSSSFKSNRSKSSTSTGSDSPERISSSLGNQKLIVAQCLLSQP